jgi:DNA-binding transcriptional ArsR family regulator
LSTQAASLDRVFHALGDPSRLAMVELLSRGPASVKELAEPFDMALPSAMKHLRVLEEGRLVSSKKSGRVRTYQLEPQALATIDRWVGRRRALWSGRFDRLDRMLSNDDERKRK